MSARAATPWGPDASINDIDPRTQFPVHEHMLITEHGDGRITIGVPWSSFSVTTTGDLREAKVSFGEQYFDLLRQSEAERVAVSAAMDEHGYPLVPLPSTPT